MQHDDDAAFHLVLHCLPKKNNLGFSIYKGMKKTSQLYHKFRLTKFLSVKVNIFLPICFGCSKEKSHGDGSFEYPQHMFSLRNKKIIILVCTLI